MGGSEKMKFIDILKEWNGGIIRGARAKFARVMNVSKVTVMRWVNGEVPSEIQLKKMSQMFNKSEEEIKAMFVDDNFINKTVWKENNRTIPQGYGNAGVDGLEEIKKELKEIILKMDKIVVLLEKRK